MSPVLAPRPAPESCTDGPPPAEGGPGAGDVAGDLALELAEQRTGQDIAQITGFPGLSTLHCLTSRLAPFQLPRL